MKKNNLRTYSIFWVNKFISIGSMTAPLDNPFHRPFPGYQTIYEQIIRHAYPYMAHIARQISLGYTRVDRGVSGYRSYPGRG